MKKKYFRNFTALGLAVIMTLSLAACGGKKPDSQGAKHTTTNVTDSNSEDSTTSEKDLYGFKEPVTIKIGIADSADFKYRDGESAEKNPWVDLYESNNIKQEIIYQVDSSQAGIKLANSIASGNYPDIILAEGTDYINYAKTGVTADITKVFEEYASDQLKEYLNADGGVAFEAAKVEGKLYGIPLLGNSYDSVMIMFVRQDWLDTVGMKMPTTMDELHQVAKAFTDKDPDGNGKNDTYGLALNGKDVFAYNSGVQAFLEGFGAAPGYWGNNFTFVEKDGKVVWGGMFAEEMKAGLTLLKEMYDDGSIAKDYGVMDNDRITQEFSAGKCGIIFAPMWGAMGASASTIKSDIKAHIVASQIPDGMGEGSSKPWFTSSTSSFYTVSNKCSNPEVLIKLLNLSVKILCNTESDEEFATYIADSEWKCSLTKTMKPLKNFDNYIKESKALESGELSILDPEQKNDYNKMKAFLDTMKTDNPNVEDETVQSGIGLYSVFGDPQGGYAALVDIKTKDNLNVSAYNTIPTDTMSSKYPTLNKLTMETIIKIISGNASVDSYDKFLEDWSKLGGQEVTAQAQTWVDANK
jgi:putative aldouronate transport system substrate-binding protein